MFHSLLVPLDGTRFSESALPLAESIARATGASVHLAHVHVPHPPDGLLSNTPFQYEGVTMDEYEEREKRRERRYIDTVVDRVKRDAGVTVDGALLEGEVPVCLEAHARATGADAVVLASHARTGVPRAWLGSVAETLVRSTTIPVLALHAQPDGSPPPPLDAVEHILVPLDGSALAEAILAPAADLAEAVDARVTLVHVTHSGLMGQSRTADAEAYLRRIVQRMEDRGLEAAAEVVVGVPAEAICATAERVGADLIALATHGRAGIRRALLGSVAMQVMHHTTLPLLVRRPALA